MKTMLLTTLVVLFAGCATPYTETAPPDDHPANPAAAASALPERSRTLDLALADSVTTRPIPAHEHEMGAGAAHQGDSSRPAAEPADAVLYACPMHPEVVSKQPARCPQCNMKLVPKKGGQK